MLTKEQLLEILEQQQQLIEADFNSGNLTQAQAEQAYAEGLAEFNAIAEANDLDIRMDDGEEEVETNILGDTLLQIGAENGLDEAETVEYFAEVLDTDADDVIGLLLDPSVDEEDAVNFLLETGLVEEPEEDDFDYDYEDEYGEDYDEEDDYDSEIADDYEEALQASLEYSENLESRMAEFEQQQVVDSYNKVLAQLEDQALALVEQGKMLPVHYKDLFTQTALNGDFSEIPDDEKVAHFSLCAEKNGDVLGMETDLSHEIYFLNKAIALFSKHDLSDLYEPEFDAISDYSHELESDLEDDIDLDATYKQHKSNNQ